LSGSRTRVVRGDEDANESGTEICHGYRESGHLGAGKGLPSGAGPLSAKVGTFRVRIGTTAFVLVGRAGPTALAHTLVRSAGKYSYRLNYEIGVESVAAPAVVLNDIIVVDTDAQLRLEPLRDSGAEAGEAFAKGCLVLLKAAAQLLPSNVRVVLRVRIVLLIARELVGKDVEQLVSAPPYLEAKRTRRFAKSTARRMGRSSCGRLSFAACCAGGGSVSAAVSTSGAGGPVNVLRSRDRRHVSGRLV
jgi:hypothetical protein